MSLSIYVFTVSVLLVPLWAKLPEEPSHRQIFSCIVSISGTLWSILLALAELCSSYYKDCPVDIFGLCLAILSLPLFALALVPLRVARAEIADQP